MEPNEFTLEYRGHTIQINEDLLKSQGCESRLDLIKQLHRHRIDIELEIERLIDSPTPILRDLADKWTHTQFALQRAWGFPPEINYHRFWELPGCECPKLDNEERRPVITITTLECPLHGLI